MTVSSTSSTSSPSLSTSTSSSGGPAITFGGVISGLNTQSIIAALMVAYKQPQVDIQNQINALNTNMSDYQTLIGQLSSMQTAADALHQTYLWDATTAASSNSLVATATTTSGASTGSLSFTVNQLAQGNVQISNNYLGSTSSTAAVAPLLIATGASQYGFSTLTTGSGLTLGTHSVSVGTALAGGSTTGSALGSSTTITTGSNDTIAATVNGTASTFTIAAGTYTQTQLAAAIQTASGGLVNATVNQSGGLALNTSLLGSSSSLQITGGTALASTGLSTMSAASVGTAGSVTVDGTVNSVNNVQSGTSLSLTSGAGGSISTVIGNQGLSTGQFSANLLSVGSGSLSDVVNAINGAGIGISASAVNLGTNQYVLQLSSSTTGTQSQITLDQSALSSTLGGMKSITAAQNSQIQVGGSGGYQVTSQTNNVTGVMNGVTLNLVSAQAAGSTPITVTVSPDAKAMAASVQTLVTDANAVLASINTYAGYNQATSTAGPLMTDPNMNTITQSILQTISTITGGTGAANAAAVGISLTSTGTINFNASTFEAAYSANPTSVSSLFSQGGSFSPSSSTYSGAVSLLYASDATQAGTYAVNISQSATQAQDAGSVISSGTITSAESLTIASSGATATYNASAGESLTAIASGLNSAFSAQGMSLNANVVTNGSGSQLVLTDGNYGSAAGFTVTSSAVGAGQTGLATTANTATSFSGIDVAGTINGVASTGVGQVLSAPPTDATLSGIALKITTSGITSSTNLGNYSYTQGLAGSLAFTGNLGSNPVTGLVTTTANNIQQQLQALQFQYNSYTPMINAEQQMLQQEFSNMEVQLGSLQSQGSWLSTAIAKLP